MKKVLVIGEILVEVMADKQDQSFLSAGTFSGPFASGAPAIFIDQVAKMNVPAVILSGVGDDDFGRMCLHRLENDGVDISNVKIISDVATGVAFVRYNSDGSRNFIYHINNAACGRVNHGDLDSLEWGNIGIFHIMGSSIFNKEMFSIHQKVIKMIPDDCVVSFDPNIRPEILNSNPELKELVIELFSSCKILFVTEEELGFLTQQKGRDESLKVCFSHGIEVIVLKRGKFGASVYTAEENFDVEALAVDEVDPTGAGDTFAGAFIAGYAHGWLLETCLVNANFAGASAVSVRGPMEGTVLFKKIVDYNKVI